MEVVVVGVEAKEVEIDLSTVEKTRLLRLMALKCEDGRTLARLDGRNRFNCDCSVRTDVTGDELEA